MVHPRKRRFRRIKRRLIRLRRQLVIEDIVDEDTGKVVKEIIIENLPIASVESGIGDNAEVIPIKEPIKNGFVEIPQQEEVKSKPIKRPSRKK